MTKIPGGGLSNRLPRRAKGEGILTRIPTVFLAINHHLIDGYVVQDNTPSAGYISWSDLHITYKGVTYTIQNGSSNKKYIWWDYDYPTVLQASDTLSSLSDDDLLVFFNKLGTHVTVPKATVVDGGLIVPESIVAGALAANSVTGANILAGSISADKIAAGAVGASAIAAGAVVSDKIAAGAITADKIAANAVGATAIAAGAVVADKIATGAVTADKIAAGAITAEKLNIGFELDASSHPVRTMNNQIWLDSTGLHMKEASAPQDLMLLNERSLQFWDYNGVPSIGIGNVANMAQALGSQMAYGLLLNQGEIRASQAVVSASLSDYSVTRTKIEDRSVDYHKLEDGSVTLPKLSETLSVTIPDRLQRAHYKPGSNLLTNPGFETGNLTGWTYSGVSAYSAANHSGMYGAYLQVNGAYLYQDVPATAGEVWGASCWAYTSYAIYADTLQLQFLSANNTVLSSVAVRLSVAGEWQFLSLTATAPTGTAKVRIRGSYPGVAYMDDFYLNKSPEVITTSYSTFLQITIPATEAVEQIKIKHVINNPNGCLVTVRGLINGVTKYETSSSLTTASIDVVLDVRSIGGDLQIAVQAKSATAGPRWVSCEVLQNQRLPIRGAAPKYSVTGSTESYCDTTCEVSCQTTCQVVCQSSCQNSCQEFCQTSCQDVCQTSCQSTCELTSQGGGGCVVEGTPITVIVDGQYIEKPVEEVRPGDLVTAYNKETDELVVAEITSNMKTKTGTVYDIITDEDSLTVTGEQPVFIRGKNRQNPEVEFQEFIPAKFIMPGDYMLKLLERRWVEVKEVRQRIVPNTWVYNPRSAPIEGYLAKGFLLDVKLMY